LHTSRTVPALALAASLAAACASDVTPPSGSPAATQPRARASEPVRTPEPASVTTRATGPVADTVRFASLVPERSFAWIQIESLDALEEVGDEILAMAADEQDGMSVEDLLEFFPAEGVIDQIDRSRPIGVAVSFSEGTMTPGSTIVLPARDRAAMVQGFRNMPDSPQVFGIDDYVVATTLPEYEPGHGSEALTEGLPAGQIVARFDVPLFIESTGDMAALALGQFAGESPNGMPTGLIEAMAGAVSSAGSLDVALQLREGQFDLSLTLTALEGSELDGLVPAGSSDLRDLAHLVDPEDSISMLMSIDPETTGRLAPLWVGAFEAALEGDVSGEADATATCLREFAALWPLMGETLAVSGAAKPGDLQLSYFFQPPDSEAFADALANVFGTLDEATPGLRVDGPIARDEQTRFWLAVEEPAEGVNLEQLQRREEDLERVFGSTRVPIRLVEKDGTSVLTIGGGKERIQRSLARLDAADELPAGLESVLAELGDTHPAFVAQIDFVAVTRDLLGRISRRDAADVEFELSPDEQPLPITYYGGVDGLEWRLGFRTDLRRFGELLRRAR
jgi:hypothetical protein